MRYQQYLRRRYRNLLRYTGGLWIIIGLTMLFPLFILPFYPDELTYIPAFLVSAIPLILLGLLLRVGFKPAADDVATPTVQEGMVAIILTWFVAIGAGAIPFMLIEELTLTQAVFEASSGWTTTGLSVVDVVNAPKIVLFYRSTLQLVGGAGFAIIVLSSITGPMGSGLSEAEGRDDQLAPNIRHSAGLVLRIYAGYIVFGSVALYLAGMSPFDAINHAFSALSTGGFSTRPESIGYWDSAAVEAVTIVLMLLGTTSFLTAWLILRGNWRAVIKNGELRMLLLSVALGVLALLLFTTLPQYEDTTRAVRVAVFEFVSAASTTGFSTVSYQGWPSFGILLLTIAMLIGGGSGSTSGGIKQMRIYVLFLALRWEIRRSFLPEHAVNSPLMWKGERQILLGDRQIRRAALFVFFYTLLFFGLALIILVHGSHAVGDALFEAASTLSTVGLSVGITSADAPATLLWTQSFAMLLGRLEFYALLIGVIKLADDTYTMLKPSS